MKSCVPILLLLAGASAAVPCYAQNFGLRQSVIGGGVACTGTSHRLAATAGQPIVGDAANLSAMVRSGFWSLSAQAVTAVSDQPPSAGAGRSFLRQNAPNPFNPTTTISFHVGKEGAVELKVYDLAGRRVRTLWNGFLPTGDHAVRWDGADDSGRTVGSGVYLARFKTDAGSQSRRMVLIK